MVDTSLEPAATDQTTGKDSRILWIEFGVVMLFCYMTSFASQWVSRGSQTDQGFLHGPLRLAGEISLLLPLLFIVAVADGDLSKIGFTKPKWKADWAWSVFLLAAMFLLRYLLRLLIGPLQFPFFPPRTSASLVADGILPISVILIMLASVMFQEALMRGYIIGRLKLLLDSNWAAVAISTLLFGMWHLYEGPRSTIIITVHGLLLALMYMRVQRIWPFIAAHFAYNMWFEWIAYHHLH